MRVWASVKPLATNLGEAWARNNLGWCAMLQGDAKRAMLLLEQALALAREIADREVIGWTLIYMGQIIWEQGDFSRATAILEESLMLLQESGDRQAHWLGTSQFRANCALTW